jgi:hypothetical protein
MDIGATDHKFTTLAGGNPARKRKNQPTSHGKTSMNYGICFAGVGVTHKKADKKEKTSLL